MQSNIAQVPVAEHSAMEAASQLPPPTLVVVPPCEAGADSVDSDDPIHGLVGPLIHLPVQLDVCIPLPSFRVQDLLALKKDRVLETAWPGTEDLPLWCGDVQLVWSEFEVIDTQLAVRVTRLV